MRCDALTMRLGTEQGRIVPADWTDAIDHVFAIGSSNDLVVRLRRGDFVQLEQRAALPIGATLLRLRSRVVTHDSAETWRLSVTVDGNEVAARVIDRTVDVYDFGANLAEFATANPRIVFRLELVDDPGTNEVVETTIPAWYIDDLIFEAASEIVVCNRNPEPNEEGVPVANPVALDVINPGLGFTSAHVYIAGVLAVANSAFEPGFGGSWIESGGTIKIEIYPPVSFEPLTTIPVQVRVVKPGDPNPAIFDYSFRTADTLAPRIVEAVATGRRTVRVTFNEAVEGAGDPASWIFAIASTSIDDGLPAVPLEVVGVASVAPNVVDVETVDDMTPGALYRILGAGITDESGNAIAAPFNASTFAGFRPAKPAGRSFDLLSMLPDLNVGEDVSGDLRKFIACLQEPTDLLLADIDEWTSILDPDTAPEAFVDAMLADLGNPFAFELDETDKRRLARLLVPIYRQKGTDPGVINAVRFFVGVEISIRVPAFADVWRLGVDELGAGALGTSSSRARYSFEIVSPIELTPTQRTRISAITNYMRDARTHLIGIVEPSPAPVEPNHLELGLSELGVSWSLH